MLSQLIPVQGRRDERPLNHTVVSRANARRAKAARQPSRIASWKQMETEEGKDSLAVCLDKLAEVPTVFGKLVHLANLQERLQNVQRQVFTDWLSYGLEKQINELTTCARGATENGTLPRNWLALAAYWELIPRGGIAEAERCLYLSDMDTVLRFVGEQAFAAESGTSLAAGRAAGKAAEPSNPQCISPSSPRPTRTAG